MTTELIIAIITAICSLIGGNLYGAYHERKKLNAEAQNIKADFVEKMQSTYTKFVEDAEQRYKNILAENKILQDKCLTLEQDNKALKQKVKKLTEEIEYINKKLVEFQKLRNRIKNQ